MCDISSVAVSVGLRPASDGRAASPRKAKLSLYGLQGHPRSEELLARLGTHTLGVGCVYATRLDRLDLDVLRELVAHAFADVTSVEVTGG